jgi:hypothetical protein
MLLAAITDVQTDLGFSAMPNIQAAISAALEIAEQTLASAIGTTFDQKQITDAFYVRTPSYRDGPNVRTELRLSRGFVNQTPAVVGTMAASNVGYGLFDIAPIYPDTLDVSANLVIDWEKGVARDITTQYCQNWLTVQYTAGFPGSGSDPMSYDLTKVPQWLQQAANLSAKIIIQSNPALEDPKIKLDTTLMQRQLNVLLGQHIRYAPAALFPSTSQAA